jgi:hypothetical protein
VPLGRTSECGVRLFLVTAERHFKHPGVELLARQFTGVKAPRKDGGRGGMRPKITAKQTPSTRVK